MRAKTGLTLFSLLLAAAWIMAQQDVSKRTASHALSEQPAQALQADLQKMRILVQQMQMNLVSLPPGPTPLRHQFELEIEMWQTLIAHMERQLPGAAPRTGSPPGPPGH